jgi:hypothetical protein
MTKAIFGRFLASEADGAEGLESFLELQPTTKHIDRQLKTVSHPRQEFIFNPLTDLICTFRYRLYSSPLFSSLGLDLCTPRK